MKIIKNDGKTISLKHFTVNRDFLLKPQAYRTDKRVKKIYSLFET